MLKAAQDPKLDLLAGVPLFAELNRRHLRRVGELCVRVDVGAGKVLCREGESGSEFFIVIDGEASVDIAGTEVATVREGGFFGELALLGGGPRTATVTTKTPMSVFVLSGAEFSSLLREEPQVAVKVLAAVGSRIRAQAADTAERRPLGA